MGLLLSFRKPKMMINLLGIVIFNAWYSDRTTYFNNSGIFGGGGVPDDQSQKLKKSPSTGGGAVPVELYGRQIRLLLTGGY